MPPALLSPPCPVPSTDSVPTPQAWERLEKAEHERELALRTELIRQEKLEQLAARFDRKAAMRETWLSENQRLVSQVGLEAPRMLRLVRTGRETVVDKKPRGLERP